VAALATAAPGDAPECAGCAATAPAEQQAVKPSPAAAQPAPRVGLLDRLAGVFHRRPGGCKPCAAARATSSAEPPASIRTVSGTDSGGGVVTALAVVPAVSKNLQDNVGHADDFVWITGELAYVHAGGGLWVLRYAGIDEEDRYGGSVILSTAVSMKNFRDGDLVSVTGEILEEGRGSKYVGGPLYRATSVNMVQRSDP